MQVQRNDLINRKTSENKEKKKKKSSVLSAEIRPRTSYLAESETFVIHLGSN